MQIPVKDAGLGVMPSRSRATPVESPSVSSHSLETAITASRPPSASSHSLVAQGEVRQPSALFVEEIEPQDNEVTAVTPVTNGQIGSNQLAVASTSDGRTGTPPPRHNFDHQDSFDGDISLHSLHQRQPKTTNKELVKKSRAPAPVPENMVATPRPQRAVVSSQVPRPLEMQLESSNSGFLELESFEQEKRRLKLKLIREKIEAVQAIKQVAQDISASQNQYLGSSTSYSDLTPSRKSCIIIFSCLKFQLFAFLSSKNFKLEF